MKKAQKKDTVIVETPAGQTQEKTNNLIRSLLEDYYDIQHYRIEVESQLRSFVQGVSEQEETFIKEQVLKKIQEIEKNITKFIEESLRNEPIWTQWLVDVKGVGPLLAAGMIAWVGDIERFATISKLWAFCGQAAGYTKSHCAKKHKIISSSLPVSCPIFADKQGKKCGAAMTLLEKVEGKIAKREVGWLILQNSRLKAHCWKIGESFCKTKGGYRKLYDICRAEYNAKWTSPDVCGSIGCKNKKKCLDGHKFAAAKRKTVKIFLAHYFKKARELKGLPEEKPFIIGRTINGVSHTHEIPIVTE